MLFRIGMIFIFLGIATADSDIIVFPAVMLAVGVALLWNGREKFEDIDEEEVNDNE